MNKIFSACAMFICMSGYSSAFALEPSEICRIGVTVEEGKFGFSADNISISSTKWFNVDDIRLINEDKFRAVIEGLDDDNLLRAAREFSYTACLSVVTAPDFKDMPADRRTDLQVNIFNQSLEYFKKLRDTTGVNKSNPEFRISGIWASRDVTSDNYYWHFSDQGSTITSEMCRGNVRHIYDGKWIDENQASLEMTRMYINNPNFWCTSKVRLERRPGGMIVLHQEAYAECNYEEKNPYVFTEGKFFLTQWDGTFGYITSNCTKVPGILDR